MIFKLKPKTTYRDGETRKIKTFCWLPRRVGDDILWLEKVTIMQQATNMYYEASHWVMWENISYEVEGE